MFLHFGLSDSLWDFFLGLPPWQEYPRGDTGLLTTTCQVMRHHFLLFLMMLTGLPGLCSVSRSFLSNSWVSEPVVL